ncbi:MAG: hypothetical protein RJA55_2336 [Acidobacteriota bacterium]|jgi:hypothetical protein
MSAATLGTLGSARAMRAEPLNDPECTECCTSLQQMGPARVLVEYVLNDFGNAEIVGAWIDSELVDADHFSISTQLAWCKAIDAELERDAAEVEWD